MRTSSVRWSGGAVVLVGLLAWGTAGAVGGGAQTPATDAPQFDGDSLVRPADYRSWRFLSSGLGMTYADEGDGSDLGSQIFQNVFVNPSSYDVFMETGAWPDGTTFILELRQSGSEESINEAGRFQKELVGFEAEVKDARLDGGWGYFNFRGPDGLTATAAPLEGETVERCITCHTEHTAVERTFVQFYPTLLEVAREQGTLNPGF